MNKWGIGLVVVIVTLVVLAAVAVMNLGTIVKVAVNTYGPGIVKTGVHVENADVSVFDTSAALENFALANPKGFSSPNAITVGSVLVNVDKTTVTSDMLVIDRIEIRQPVITYEIKGTTDNFRTIINNIKKPATPEETGKKPEEKKKKGKKVVIRDLILKDITIKTVAEMVGGDIAEARVSEIHLKNLGEKQSGVDMAQAAIIVLNKIYTQVVSGNISEELKNRITDIENNLNGVREKTRALGDQLKGLFGK